MTTSRRTFLTLSVGLGLALTACSSPATTPSPAKSSAIVQTIGLTYIPNIQFAPFYTGKALRLFGDAVELRHHGSSEGLFSALIADKEHYVVAAADEMMQARAEGMDLVAVAQLYRSYPVVLVVPEDSPIKTPADVRGHTLGVPGRFGASWFGTQVLLKSGGLKESDVKIQEIGYTLVAALSGRKVDAVVGFSNNDVVNLVAAGVKIRTIPLAPEKVPLVSACLITTRKHLEAQPEAVRSVVAGFVKATEAVIKDPAAAITHAEAHVPSYKSDATQREAAVRTLAASIDIWKGPQGVYRPQLEEAQFADMATFMKENGLVSGYVEPNKAMTNEFLPKS